MFIAGCQIKNYKSFKDSEKIRFWPGFNVVVGQNNAGKTALVEALSVQFSNNPHRSLVTRPEGNSSVKMTFGIEPHEGFDFIGNAKQVYLPEHSNVPAGQTIDRFQHSFSRQFTVGGEFDPHQNLQFVLLGDASLTPVNHVVPVMVQNDILVQSNGAGKVSSLEELVRHICLEAKRRIYFFRAERLNVGTCGAGVQSNLAADAHNLAEVLHLLQSKNKRRFSRFVQDVRTVFPDIQDVAVVPMPVSQVRIDIWFVDPTTEREDLAVPLADCGTGIGQVLAMLYVVITSEESRTILIDEPQSFLHPGAIQKLFEILKRDLHRKHQFIVTTHSPTVVTAASPCSVILLRRQENETKVETIDVDETSELRQFLSEIGARLSDVFGCDKILWVEGRTEEVCFRRIAEQMLKIELLGTEIIGVTHVGDLEGRHKKVVLEIYQKLCKGRGLLPPALGFCFDQEGRSAAEQEELVKESSGLIQFIPRRMYENYLLNPKAIVAILNEADSNRDAALTEQDVSKWIADNGSAATYISASESSEWSKRVDAAKLLKDLFSSLSETRVCFDKLKHGPKLTDWIIQNSPADFDELATFLRKILQK